MAYWRENLHRSFKQWGRWEVLLAFTLYLVGGAIAAISPDWAAEPIVVRILAGAGLVAVLHALLLVFILTPMQMYRERAGTSETVFAFTERGAPHHVSPIGAARTYTPLRIRNQGSERATVEGLTASVSLGFRGEGTNWHTNPHAAVPSFPPFALPGDPSERSWRVKENSHWELLGLPVVVRGGGDLVLPNVGVEIVDESKVREEYQRPEGAFLLLDVYIRSNIETVRISHTIPVMFSDDTGADLVASEPAS